MMSQLEGEGRIFDFLYMTWAVEACVCPILSKVFAAWYLDMIKYINSKQYTYVASEERLGE